MTPRPNRNANTRNTAPLPAAARTLARSNARTDSPPIQTTRSAYARHPTKSATASASPREHVHPRSLMRTDGVGSEAALALSEDAAGYLAVSTVAVRARGNASTLRAISKAVSFLL
jgi:hypothetical protein